MVDPDSQMFEKDSPSSNYASQKWVFADLVRLLIFRESKFLTMRFKDIMPLCLLMVKQVAESLIR